jgi:hypothetical protein
MHFYYLNQRYSMLSATQQLYTPRGSQGFGIDNGIMKDVGVSYRNYSDTYLLRFYTVGEQNFYFEDRSLFQLK